MANIVGPSDILSDNNHIYSERGTYNTMTGKAYLLDRSVLTNEGKQLTGDSLFYDRNEGLGEAFRNMVLTDTINKNMMTGEYGFYNEKEDMRLLPIRPLPSTILREIVCSCMEIHC